MEDNAIIDLYWARDQKAIVRTEEKYGKYCYKIAWNVLREHRDCEECISDTWLRAWNRMPSERPGILLAFLGAITRNLSLDRYRRSHAAKRGGGEMPFVYEELQDCVSSRGPEEEFDGCSLTEALNGFLEGLKKDQRMIFVRRYWYLDSMQEIAKKYGISESKVKTDLFRMRKKLQEYLREQGFRV